MPTIKTISTITTKILLAVAAATLLVALLSPDVTFAQLSEVQKGVNATGTSSGPTVDTVITRVINLFSYIVGVISVIMIIIGGLKYITSSGDATNVSSAKNTILYAVIGLVIVVMAQVIVRFVLASTVTPTP
jgi:TRAP-type C4-dicarboxylate transport system permease small subunit